MGTYCHEVSSEEVAIAYLLSTGSFICHRLVKKTHDLWKKSHVSNTQVQDTFDVARIDNIFDFLLKEKPKGKGHQ